MQVKRYDVPLSESIPEADCEVDQKAREYMVKNPDVAYISAVKEILKSDPGLAAKYYGRPETPEPDESKCIEAETYTDAMKKLHEAALDFSLTNKVPYDLAFKRELVRPEHRKLARKYLEGAPSSGRQDD